jgi:hypothetical protein
MSRPVCRQRARSLHPLHTAIAAGAAITGLIVAGLSAGRQGNALSLLVAVLAPIAVMFMMWPSEYAFFETHPGGHALEHLGIAALGFLSAFCGQRYASGVGWAMAIGLVDMAFLSAFGFGVSPL